MKFVNLIMLAIAVATPPTLASANTWYGLNGTSYHFEDSGSKNKRNLGASILWDCADFECQVGAYVNSRGWSVKNTTPYFVVDRLMYTHKDLRLGGFLGGAYYPDNGVKSESYRLLGGAVAKYSLDKNIIGVLRASSNLVTFGVELK